MSYLDYLKRNVFPGESGGDYDALFGYSNRPGGQFGGVRLTDMTVSDALNFSAPSGPYGQWVKGQVGRVATPMGAYQVVGTTLRAAKEGLGLTGNERMTPELQDRIGMWIYENQGPAAWEAWGKGGGSRATMSSSGGAPMGLLNFQEEQRPQTFMERLGIQRRDPNAGGQTALPFHQRDNFGDFMGTLGASLMGLDMTTRDMAPAAMAQVENRKERRAQKETVNRTAAWLEAQGRPDLAEAVRGGVIDGASAFTVMNQPAEARGQIVDAAQLRQMFPGATIEDGLYNLKPDGTANKIGGGGTVVNNNMGGGKFEEAFAKGDADTIATVGAAGATAIRNMGRIDQLEQLLATAPQGVEGALKSIAGEFGIPTEGLSDIQAAQALINSLVPEQRQPGSGPMSDADLALFKQSLPRIINQPGGNALIIQTMRAIAQYDAEGAQIVQELRAGSIDRPEAFRRLQARTNPLATFKGAPGGAAAPAQPGTSMSRDEAMRLLMQGGQ